MKSGLERALILARGVDMLASITSRQIFEISRAGNPQHWWTSNDRIFADSCLVMAGIGCMRQKRWEYLVRR